MFVSGNRLFPLRPAIKCFILEKDSMDSRVLSDLCGRRVLKGERNGMEWNFLYLS